MTFKCNPELRAILNGSPHKLRWSTDLLGAMGNDRTVRAFRDADANAADPFLTGTEFRRLKSTGAFTTKAGAITKIGRLNGTTISLPADMFSGASCLRVEGNGHWFQGTMGPSPEAQQAAGVPLAQIKHYDFQVSRSFTANNGFGVRANLVISGPRFMASGVGAAAPDLTANAPYSVEFYNWKNPASPVLLGSIILRTRNDNLVFEDQEHQLTMGDTAVYHSATTVPYDDFEFGATLFASDKSNGEGGVEPLYEVAIQGAVRQAVWPGYPDRTNFNPAVHTYTPAAFKAVIKNQAGNILHIHQMADGSAVNSVRSLPYMRNSTTACRPNWTVNMILPWRNQRPKMSPKLTKYYPGMRDDFKRPSVAKQSWTVTSVEPYINGGYGRNSTDGLQHYYAMDKWPAPFAYQYVDPADPYLSPAFYQSGGKADRSGWATGWGYEPGSFSGHNWYTGPGGPRFDRAPVPSAIAIWASDPNGARLRGNVPWRDMAHDWNLAYCNHSNHPTTDPRKLMLDVSGKAMLENWRIAQHYYGGDDTHAGKKVWNTHGNMRDDIQPQHLDKNGQLFNAGWGRDGLHSYGTAGWAALSEKSPMMAVVSKWDTFWQLVTNHGIDYSGTNGWHYRDNWMVRSQAWMYLQYCMGWKLASNHELGISREVIEGMFIRHCEDVHRSIVVPYRRGDTGNFFDGMRNLGVPVDEAGQTQGGGLGMYMAGTMMVMKQTGFFAAIKAKSSKAAEVFALLIELMDKYVGDITLTSGMRYYPPRGADGDQHGWPTAWTGAYTTWAQHMPPQDQLDLFHYPDGTRWGDPEVSIWPFLSYPYIRRDFFPEYADNRQAAVIAKLDSIFAKVAGEVAAKTNAQDKMNTDYSQGYPGIVPPKAPAELGPA